MKILIAIPCMETVPVTFVESLMALRHPENAQVSVRFHKNSLVYDARNLLSLGAIQDGYDYVLWLDSDMTFPHDTLTRLLDDIKKSESEMVTGLYVKRTMPTKPVIYYLIEPPTPNAHGIPEIQICEWMNYPKDETFAIAGCGFGCVLTSVKLLKDVWDRYGPAFAPLPWAGEDISFCYRVEQMYREKGEHQYIFCDSRIKCGHIGSFLFTEQLLKRGEQT